MVEAAGRTAAVRRDAMKKKKKLVVTRPPLLPPPGDDKEEEQERRRSRSRKQLQQSRQLTTTEPPPESPSYRLAFKSLFSCRNSHGHSQSQQQHDSRDSSSSRSKNKLGCSAPSICKLSNKQDSRQRVTTSTIMRPPPQPQPQPQPAEPCNREQRRASSASGSSERHQQQCVVKYTTSSSSSSSGGGSFRAGMQLRRLSGCYECHMVVDPISGSGSSSMRAAICPCPDCGEIFVRQESLQLHQSIRHAVSELGPEDTSRNIIDIIFQSSWLKKQSPVCQVERILKVHNTARTLARFEEYRDAVKARAGAAAGGQPALHASSSSSRTTTKHPRCTADGNELLRFYCAALGCPLGLGGATHLCCDAAGQQGGCAACGIIRDGFRMSAAGGVRTMATSGRAHDAAEEEEDGEEQRRAMLVCRVIAGRVKRPATEGECDEEEEEHDSVAVGSAGVYSNLEELLVFSPRAILPCFVVVYKA